jgi:hypothetical protein
LQKIRPTSAEDVATQKRGIAFYSYNQIRNTRPVGRIGAMLVGLFYLGWGLSRLHDAIVFRRAETKAFGSAELHVGAFIVAFALLGIGAFVGHVGVIYYFRKLYRWASNAHMTRVGTP